MAQIIAMPAEKKDCSSRPGAGRGAVVVMARLVICRFEEPLSDFQQKKTKQCATKAKLLRIYIRRRLKWQRRQHGATERELRRAKLY
jgi:hypothetical protein